MKNAFDGLINRIDKAEEGISELENISVETYLKKNDLKETEYPRTVGQLQKVCCYGLNVCVPHKFICCNPNLKGIGVRRWGF